MGTTQITTCDCCGATLNGTSVLDCVAVTFMVAETGLVEQTHYGLECGCGKHVLGVLGQVAGDHPHTPESVEPLPEPAAATGTAQ